MTANREAPVSRCPVCRMPVYGPPFPMSPPHCPTSEPEHNDGPGSNCTSDENCDHPTHYNGCPMQHNGESPDA